MKKRLEERKINLCDMFWEICLKWRSILACAIVLAVLLGGYSYYKSSQTMEQEITKLKIEDLEDTDKERVSVYQQYKKMYASQCDYNQNSPIMGLNANEFYKGELVFCVDSGEAHLDVMQFETAQADKAEVFAEFYLQKLKTEEVITKIVQTLSLEETEKKYASEYITLQTKYGEIEPKERNKNLFTVHIYAQNAEECAALVQLVKEEVMASKATAISDLGNHEVKELSSTYGVTADEQLFEYQEQNISDMYTSQKSIADIKAKLSDKALQYLSEQKSSEDNEEVVEESMKPTSASVSIKYVVIGFVGGAFAAVCVLVLVYLFNMKLRSSDDFEEIYGVKLLGKISAKNRKKKMLGFVDNFIYSVRMLGKKPAGEKEVMEMICAGIKISAQKLNLSKVFICGTVMDNAEKEVMKVVASELKNQGIEIVVGSSILNSAKSLETVAEIGAVVFVEHAGLSNYEEIAKEIELCTEINTAVLGSILVE